MFDVLGRIISLRQRGAVFGLKGGKVHCRLPASVTTVTAEEKRILTVNGPIVEAILSPDEGLPDVVIIPASCPNTIEAITICIAGQRIRKQAAFFQS